MVAQLKPYSAYKDSNVPWLGDVPEHWQVKKGKWLFRKMNRPVNEEDEVVTCFRDGVVTLRKNRRVRGFTESLKEVGYQGVHRNDLVIHAMDAFAGAIGVSDSNGKATPVYSVCAPIFDSNPHFYAYTLREMARSQWIQSLATGIRERSTDFRFYTFGSQLLPIPPPYEQTAIVRYLDYMDRRIRRYVKVKQKLIKLLEEQKNAVVHHAVTRGLDPNVPLKPSGVEWLGEVPGHWEVLALKRVLRKLIDCEHKTAPAIDESEYRVVRTAAIRNGDINLKGTYCTTENSFIEWTRRGLPEPGDVIFTREAPCGEACVVPNGQRLCLGQRTVLMKVQEDQYNPFFLVYMIYGGPPSHTIKLASQGSTVDHFNVEDIAALTILAPPLSEQIAIVNHIKNKSRGLDHSKQQNQHEISILHEYRTRLIFDVVTGKLDVREVVEHLPLEADNHLEPIGEVDMLDECEKSFESVKIEDNPEEVEV